MRKTLFPLVVLTFVLFPLVAPLSGPHFYESQDGFPHLLKVIAVKQALWEGQFPPRWAGNLAQGLGSPILSFNFPLPFLLTTPLYTSGLSAAVSLKIILIAATLLSGLAAYLWLRNLLGPFAATVGAVAWSWAPYRLLNLYHRAAVGEVLATLFLPLLLFAYDRLCRMPRVPGILGLPLALLILSHNVLALMGIALLIFYIALIGKKPIPQFALVREIAIGLGLTSFFWLPALTEANTVQLSGLLQHAYLANFPPLQSLIYSKWGGGQMSFQLGLVHWTMFPLFLLLLKRKPRLLLFGLILAIGSLLLTQPLTIPLYKIIPLLPNVLYPWRFIGLGILGIAVLAALLVEKKRALLAAGLITLFILANRNHLGISRIAIDESPLQGLMPYTADTDGEFLPISADRVGIKQSAIPTRPSFLITHDPATATVWEDRGHLITGLIQAKGPSELIINRFYWPGWVAYINGQKQTLSAAKETGGRMKLYLPQGNHILKILLENTPIRTLGNSGSLITFILLLVLWVHYFVVGKRT